MGTNEKREERRNRVLVIGTWAAGIALTLVEMQLGVEYVMTHVVYQVGALAGWLPMIGALAAQFWG
ncbi:MAG TPA: hypothetical protein VEJ47_22195 [Candidatus Eremiobacteraceae bacterium]|nr:hypothetical protein [Candidatus Eremiobacteraceae bacterium]